MARGAIKPTGAQLSEAIAGELKALKTTPTTKDLQSSLLKNHPNWTVPERRVKKFLKRCLSNHADPSRADDDATVATAVPTKGRFFQFFKATSNKKKSAPAAIPEAAPTQPSSPVGKPASPRLEPPIEGPASPEPVVKSRSVESAYTTDDNDGTKKDCSCGAGEACAIM